MASPGGTPVDQALPRPSPGQPLQSLPLRMAEVLRRDPGPDQLLVRVAACRSAVPTCTLGRVRGSGEGSALAGADPLGREATPQAFPFTASISREIVTSSPTTGPASTVFDHLRP